MVLSVRAGNPANSTLEGLSGGGFTLPPDAEPRTAAARDRDGPLRGPGYFYMGAHKPDVFQVTTRPADGQARVADCSNVESIIEGGGVHTVPSPLGAPAFSVGGGGPGYNPCDPNATGIDCEIAGPATVLAGSGGDIFSWSLCATIEFRSAGPNGLWPAAGSGNLITWDPASRCQRTEPGGFGSGVVATAGYSYCGAYSPDVLRVIPRPVDGQAKVADCSAVESLIGGVGYPTTVPSHLGIAQFSADGSVSGYNPCGVVTPVRVTTWSANKGMYH